MHNPWDGKYPLVCDWTCHVTRTPPSSGGDDYAMNTGTPVIAAFDGVLTNRPPVQYPASGNVAILSRADGLDFYHLHLNSFVTPGPVHEGDIIGYSGNTGHSTGPHLHVNAYYNGVIRDVHDFYTTTTTAGSGETPIGVDMPLNAADQTWLNGLGASIVDQVVRATAATLAPIEAQLRADLGTVHQAILDLPKPVVGGDNTVLLAAVADLKTLVQALPKPPTSFIAAP